MYLLITQWNESSCAKITPRDLRNRKIKRPRNRTNIFAAPSKRWFIFLQNFTKSDKSVCIFAISLFRAVSYIFFFDFPHIWRQTTRLPAFKSPPNSFQLEKLMNIRAKLVFYSETCIFPPKKLQNQKVGPNWYSTVLSVFSLFRTIGCHFYNFSI